MIDYGLKDRVALITGANNPQGIAEDDLRTDFLNFCFEHMIDVEEFPGNHLFFLLNIYGLNPFCHTALTPSQKS